MGLFIVEELRVTLNTKPIFLARQNEGSDTQAHHQMTKGNTLPWDLVWRPNEI